jgi:arsenate reductase (thioredoxin)
MVDVRVGPSADDIRQARKPDNLVRRLLMKEKKRILFLCTGNACRSQMAEGWVRHLKGDLFEPHSAGVSPHGLDQRAVRVMREAGVDISGQRSKHVDEFDDVDFDYVITLCDSAQQACPVFPATTRVIHMGFPDPPILASGAQSEEEALVHYRRVCREIRAFVERLPEAFEE